MQSSIDICVITYKRPELLANLLTSLARQSLRHDCACRVVVVDNDGDQSAERVVKEFAVTSGMEVIYDIEARQGISYARNKALSHVKASMFAFIDDDEVASPDWLKALHETLERYRADVVFGPVVGRLPATTPSWAHNHPCFVRPRLLTGTRVKYGATGNVLAKTMVVADRAKPFDERYAVTGGEDTELFNWLCTQGRFLVWCDEAEVSEIVPSQRVKIAWVCRRAFRSGQTYYRIFVSPRPRVAKTYWVANRVLALVLVLIALPALALAGTTRLVAGLCRASGWLGQISQAVFKSYQYEEYRGDRP